VVSDPPVIVAIYIVQNFNMMHTITLSYRETEQNLWKADFEKVIYTFDFVEQK